MASEAQPVICRAAGEPLILWDQKNRRWVDLRWLSQMPVRRGERIVLLPPGAASRQSEATTQRSKARELAAVATLATVGALVIALALAALQLG